MLSEAKHLRRGRRFRGPEILRCAQDDVCAYVRVVCVLLAVFAAASAVAHDPLLDLPAPTSVSEAWNVITQSVANVEKCLDTNQLKELAYHVANCSPAIRVLQADAKAVGVVVVVRKLLTLGAPEIPIVLVGNANAERLRTRHGRETCERRKADGQVQNACSTVHSVHSLSH